MSAPNQHLLQEALDAIRKVKDDPHARYKLREDFYQQYGGTPGSVGLGNSELDFLSWEIHRGVLDPHTGSPWWNAVNLKFCYYSVLGELVFRKKANPHDFPPPVQLWVDFIEKPSPQSWYRAHNSSIIAAYLTETGLARTENDYEQQFMNVVLYRVLFAQAMVEGLTLFGEVGERWANPKGEAVNLLIHLPDAYPQSYPMDSVSYEECMGAIDDLADFPARFLNKVLILPKIQQLYLWAAEYNAQPGLLSLLNDRGPIYPKNLPQIEETQSGEKKKIAILGGGISGLSAAMLLTDDPDWQKHYEITLYQQGWRCGGKMRGGRGPHGRVEELGLHLLLGWYEYAFPLYRRAYRERVARNLPRGRYDELDQAIVQNNATLLVEYRQNRNAWVNWPLIFPPNQFQSGEGGPLPNEYLVKKGMGILLTLILGSPYAKPIWPLTQWILDHYFPESGGVPQDKISPPKKPSFFQKLFEGLRMIAEIIDDFTGWHLAKELYEEWDELQDDSFKLIGKLCKFLDGVLDFLKASADKLGIDNDELRHLYYILEMGVCLGRGLMNDVWDPKTNQFNYRAINHLDFREWMRKNGCSEETLYSPMIEFFYTGTFEALDDHNDHGGLLAAGTALQFFLPALGYKGSFCYQLTLGTADTLIMPVYQALEARGVKFQFFHRVQEIKANGTEEIQEIRMMRQVDLAGSTYDPKILVGPDASNLNPAWPGEPKWDLLNPQQAQELQQKKINLEDPWSGWPGVGQVSLHKGKDFDAVFLGIPVKALGHCAQDLIQQKPAWKQMVEKAGSAQIMSSQLWFEDSLEQMGYHHADWGMAEKFQVPNVVTYQNPLFSFLDQSYIIKNEAWPQDRQPKVLMMFTGILPDEYQIPDFTDQDFPKTQHLRVKYLTWQWLKDNMGFFLPGIRTKAYPPGIDFGRLFASNPTITDMRAKFEDQFFMAAIAPEDRYTIALPNTEQYRLKPYDSKYGNLWLVGDWTDYGANIGYMEGCIFSSHQAVDAFLMKDGISFLTELG